MSGTYSAHATSHEEDGDPPDRGEQSVLLENDDFAANLKNAKRKAGSLTTNNFKASSLKKQKLIDPFAINTPRLLPRPGLLTNIMQEEDAGTTSGGPSKVLEPAKLSEAQLLLEMALEGRDNSSRQGESSASENTPEGLIAATANVQESNLDPSRKDPYAVQAHLACRFPGFPFGGLIRAVDLYPPGWKIGDKVAPHAQCQHLFAASRQAIFDSACRVLDARTEVTYRQKEIFKDFLGVFEVELNKSHVIFNNRYAVATTYATEAAEQGEGLNPATNEHPIQEPDKPSQQAPQPSEQTETTSAPEVASTLSEAASRNLAPDLGEGHDTPASHEGTQAGGSPPKPKKTAAERRKAKRAAEKKEPWYMDHLRDANLPKANMTKEQMAQCLADCEKEKAEAKPEAKPKAKETGKETIVATPKKKRVRGYKPLPDTDEGITVPGDKAAAMIAAGVPFRRASQVGPDDDEMSSIDGTASQADSMLAHRAAGSVPDLSSIPSPELHAQLAAHLLAFDQNRSNAQSTQIIAQGTGYPTRPQPSDMWHGMPLTNEYLQQTNQRTTKTTGTAPRGKAKASKAKNPKPAKAQRAPAPKAAPHHDSHGRPEFTTETLRSSLMTAMAPTLDAQGQPTPFAPLPIFMPSFYREMSGAMYYDEYNRGMRDEQRRQLAIADATARRHEAGRARPSEMRNLPPDGPQGTQFHHQGTPQNDSRSHPTQSAGMMPPIMTPEYGVGSGSNQALTHAHMMPGAVQPVPIQQGNQTPAQRSAYPVNNMHALPNMGRYPTEYAPTSVPPNTPTGSLDAAAQDMAAQIAAHQAQSQLPAHPQAPQQAAVQRQATSQPPAQTMSYCPQHTPAPQRSAPGPKQSGTAPPKKISEAQLRALHQISTSLATSVDTYPMLTPYLSRSLAMTMDEQAGLPVQQGPTLPLPLHTNQNPPRQEVPEENSEDDAEYEEDSEWEEDPLVLAARKRKEALRKQKQNAT